MCRPNSKHRDLVNTMKINTGLKVISPSVLSSVVSCRKKWQDLCPLVSVQHHLALKVRNSHRLVLSQEKQRYSSRWYHSLILSKNKCILLPSCNVVCVLFQLTVTVEHFKNCIVTMLCKKKGLYKHPQEKKFNNHTGGVKNIYVVQQRNNKFGL